MFQIGDLVKRKNALTYNLCGIITKVYESRIKTTVEVMWFDTDSRFNTTCTIEPYFLEKLS